jgi:hypothetical protein
MNHLNKAFNKHLSQAIQRIDTIEDRLGLLGFPHDLSHLISRYSVPLITLHSEKKPSERTLALLMKHRNLVEPNCLVCWSWKHNKLDLLRQMATCDIIASIISQKLTHFLYSIVRLLDASCLVLWKEQILDNYLQISQAFLYRSDHERELMEEIVLHLGWVGKDEVLSQSSLWWKDKLIKERVLQLDWMKRMNHSLLMASDPQLQRDIYCLDYSPSLLDLSLVPTSKFGEEVLGALKPRLPRLSF